jgi:hypothetical protein
MTLPPDLYSAARRFCDALIDRYDIAALKTVDYYRRVLSRDVRDLYSGKMPRGAFEDDMLRLIDEQLTRAWNEGSRSVGVEPEDMTADDLDVVEKIKDSELGYIGGFADAIEEAAANGTGWDALMSRVDLWVNRYNDVVNSAVVYFGGKTRLKWTLGATEEHCKTCARLDGIVAWADEWQESGLKPQQPPNDLLSCGGWRCDCSCLPTDERRTRNALNILLDIAVSRNV